MMVLAQMEAAVQPDHAHPAAAPFLKWVGGKSALLDQYATLFPAAGVRAYYEPFVGGGAVFFHLRGRGLAGHYALSDINAGLMNLYAVVRDQVEALIAALAHHRERHSRQHFYATRRLDRDPGWPDGVGPVEQAARLLYLNKTCYNGLWRVNARGQFNAPLGRYTSPPILDVPRLRAASRALAGVSLAVCPFDEAVAGAGPGDFVYFDPPYVPVSATASFTGYYPDGFAEAEQRRLAATFRDLDRRGCRVMLSNSDHPLVRELYAGFRIEVVRARRAVNARPDRRGPVSEIVVLNYP